MEELAPRGPRFTYREYCNWPGDERWELIDGVPHNMTPAPSREHQRLSVLLTTQIAAYLQGRECEVYHAPFDVRLPEKDEPDDRVINVVQPDIAVICAPEKLDDKGCRGAPDFVIEILSPRTSSKDSNEKKELYERHGVREYWLVDPVHRTVSVFLLDGNGQYGEPAVAPLSLQTSVSIFPGLVIHWDG